MTSVIAEMIVEHPLRIGRIAVACAERKRAERRCVKYTERCIAVVVRAWARE